MKEIRKVPFLAFFSSSGYHSMGTIASENNFFYHWGSNLWCYSFEAVAWTDCLISHTIANNCFYKNNTDSKGIDLTQLVEWLLPIPEVYGSNPVIGKNLYWTFTVNCIEKTKIKKKRPRMGLLKKYRFERVMSGFEHNYVIASDDRTAKQSKQLPQMLLSSV